MIKKLTNILKPTQLQPQPNMSTDLLTICSKAQRSQKNQARLKNSDATTPRLYGIPKLQKENNILRRPIVFFTDSPTYGLLKNFIITAKTTYWKIKISRKKLFRLRIIYCSITPNLWTNGLIRCCIFIHKSSNSVGMKHSQATSTIQSRTEWAYAFVNYRPN